jgi:hypothetical protein
MSLSISLISDTPIKKKGTGVYFRENGENKELSPTEIQNKFPEVDISLYPETEYETNEVWEGNITHNLGQMATKACLYDALWRPHRLHPDYPHAITNTAIESEFEETHRMKAEDIISFLVSGLFSLRRGVDEWKKMNPANGWGTYEQLADFVVDYAAACLKYPNATIEVSR